MMYNNKRLAIDLDDTISNTSKTIKKYAKNFHVKVLKRKYKKFKLSNVDDYFYFALELGWNGDDVSRFFKTCYPNYLKFVKPLKYVRKALFELHMDGWEIHIISARHYSDREDVFALTKKWLNKYRIYFDTLDIGNKNKIDDVKKYNCSLFIDDSYRNCIDIAEQLNIDAVLFCTKYNETYQKDENLKLLKNWKDFLIWRENE